MYFKSISIKNFRNYKEQTLEFDKKLNIFLGENAQGKTNLLEGLFVMGLGKSFRTNKDTEMISFGSENARAKSIVCSDDGRENEIEIDYSREGKIIKLDGIKIDRAMDMVGNVYIVVFAPDDLKIVKEGPDNRRKYLDRELCQIKPVYYSDLGNYKRVLKQRNMMLRQNTSDFQLFDVFDEALADYGIRIVDERERFIKRVEEISRGILSEISGGKEVLSLSYETRISPAEGKTREERKEEYKELLAKSFESDIYKGFTGFGPHKDDLKIEIDGIDIRQFGSQGQQRSAALSMKLAEIELIRQETGEKAVLLLDDVLSELDKNRQRFLIEAMSDVQVFITTTSIDEKLMQLLPAGKSFTVESGNVLT